MNYRRAQWVFGAIAASFLLLVVLLSISNPASATLGSPSSATFSIPDDDGPPSVFFSSDIYSVDEGSSVPITVMLSAASSLIVAIDLDITDGTASAPSDYTDVSGGSLVFSPGQTALTFSIPIMDDLLDEPTETVTLTLSNPSNAILGAPSSATLYILDDDDPPAVSFSNSSYVVAEPSVSATIQVELSAPSGWQISVDFATSDGTANEPDDYAATNGTLTFNPGQTSQSFSVPIMCDAIDEATETVNLTLSNPTNATLGSPSSATLSIFDACGGPQSVQFGSTVYSVNESDGMASVQVTLSPASALQVTVNYATSDGTATAGEDYESANGTLIFNPGETTKPITIPIICDATNEPTETVNLMLSSPVNATLGSPSSATLYILASCGFPPSVFFSSASYSVDEGVGSAPITVTLSATSAYIVTVNYGTADGTASAPDDYADVAGTLIFSPGQTIQTFSVPINDDLIYEPTETVILWLASPVNAVLGAPSSATLYILDDDDPPAVSFSYSSYTVAETEVSATIQVELSAPSGWEVSVDYATSDGTAIAPGDYTTVSGTLSFAPGQTTNTFSVQVADDSIDEGNETVILTLSDANNATIGDINPAILTITKGFKFYLPVVLHQFRTDAIDVTIRGRVFEDLNSDGVCVGTGEPGLASIPIDFIHESNARIVLQTVQDGTYSLGGVALGTWQVIVQPPTGFEATSQESFSVTLTSEQPEVTGIDFCVARSPFTFTKDDVSPQYLQNFANNAGCNWLGIGGEVIGLDNEPVPYGAYRVHIWDSGIDSRVTVGDAPAYGPSGYEQFLFDAPRVQEHNIQLETANGTAVSQIYRVQTRASCNQNLLFFVFEQIP